MLDEQGHEGTAVDQSHRFGPIVQDGPQPGTEASAENNDVAVADRAHAQAAFPMRVAFNFVAACIDRCVHTSSNMRWSSW